MSRLPTARHWAAWAGRCPGAHASAGQRRSGTTRQGSRWRRQVRIAAAHAAARTQHTDRAAHDHRRAARRGTKKALVARGHPIRVLV
jgi:hypothetical protein